MGMILRNLAPFAAATLVPALFILTGFFGWGSGAWAALFILSLGALALDSLPLPIPRTDDADADTLDLAAKLSEGLAWLHLLLLFGGIAVLALPGGLGLPAKIALFFALGLWFGQVSNSNAHELIHRSDRRGFLLGVAVYTTLLFGHHASAHRLIHHRFVATPDDPNSAPEGMSVWRFLPRAWWGSFRKAARAEAHRQLQQHRHPWGRGHPYWIYVGGALAALTLSWLLAGVWGIVLHIMLAGHATTQLLINDYVQHYGLRRATGPDGRYEPVADRHSWNAPRPFTDLLMLNAPLHSDHHAHPATPYPDLQMTNDMPNLPRSLPVMVVMAMFPARFRAVMAAPLDKWRKADIGSAGESHYVQG